MSKHSKSLARFLVPGAMLLAGFFIGYLAGFRYGIKLERQNLAAVIPSSLPAPLAKADVSPAAEEIFKELNCICGCKMELLPCTCKEVKGSKEIRQFVQALLAEGLPKPEVVRRLVDHYGQSIIKKRG